MQGNLRHGQVSLYAGSGFKAAYLTDADRQSIFDNDMKPDLSAGDFDGALAVALCIPWYFSRSVPVAAGQVPQASLRGSLAYVARIRNVWLYGLTILGINGCIQGTLGYIPLYLRGLGWPAVSADGALRPWHDRVVAAAALL